MRVLVLWFGQDDRVSGVARRLGANRAVAVEQVTPVRETGILGTIWHRLAGSDVALRPLRHDPASFGCVALCFAVPGNRMPVAVASSLRRSRSVLPQLALVLIPDHVVSDTSAVIEQCARLAGRRPIALQELPVPELEPDGSGSAARPWLSQCHIESFLSKLGLAVPDPASPAKETT